MWTYDTGFRCCGNNELETYCAADSSTAPCSENPNAYIDESGILHIVAVNPSGTTYTSARLKTQGLFSFMYGRIEARMKLPESQGMWPAFWLLGNNITTVSWPACGELDVMEHIDGNNPPPYCWRHAAGLRLDCGVGARRNQRERSKRNAAISSSRFSGERLAYLRHDLEQGAGAVLRGRSGECVCHVYASELPGHVAVRPGAAVHHSESGGGRRLAGECRTATTVFPGDMQVDYVRIYTN